MDTWKVALYLLAIITSFACMIFLFRGYKQKRVRLLFWSGVCFVGLTVNNVLLFVDLVTFPAMDLRPARFLASLAGMLCMLYSFIWKSQ